MQRIENKVDIREELILTAMALYAQKGLDGISLRQIGVAAGAKNSGVMQYHFGSKLGVITAIMEKTVAAVLPQWRQHPPKDANDVEELVRQTIKNVDFIIGNYPWGKDAIKVISRMLMETDNDIRHIINLYFSPITLELLERICEIYPHVDKDKLRLRILIALDCIIHGASEWVTLRNSPVGTFSIDKFQELEDELSDFVEGGITFKL